MEITELLRHTVEVGASDLHLTAGNVPFVRVDGELSPTAFGACLPAVEVLVSTGRVSDRIIDPEATIEIRDIIGEGGFYGMQTFDQALVGLVEGGLVTEEDARFASTRPHDFLLALRGTLARS